ncbi:NUDIX domain-containing protein [Candidatus Saccharibacteria bacterium]|nr:NUDIX domain-containing protein [Candidatus Saccharibacteria bacterium]
MAMKKFYVGVKAIINDPERGVLLLKDPRIIDVPGGRIDGDESFEGALRREISEELPETKVISIGDMLGSYRVPVDVAENTGLILIFFRVEAKVPSKVALSNEHSEYIWVNKLEDIPEVGINDEIRRIVSEILQ